METVRFSIIENDLRWQEAGYEDQHEISSESSGGGVANDSQPQNTPKFIHEIWKICDVQKSLQGLPKSDVILDLIHKEDFSSISNSHSDINIALLLATWFGRPKLVSLLIEVYRADPNATDDKGRTPLHLAAMNTDANCIKALLRAGARTHIWDATERITPLHCAACSGNADCLQLLIRNGAQVNAGIEHRSALHYAIENNAVNCVHLLLVYGASPNTPQVFTETPLHVAAGLGYSNCMKLLIEHGADVRSQFGKRKLTALHIAVEEDFINCVKILLDAGANINVRNSDYQTPLHIACLLQSTEIVDLLITRGADVNLVYKDGRTALHAAIVRESKDWECAKLLLMAGVKVNKPDHYGYTPLHMAALNEFGPCVYLLIEYGADITARTNGGISALSFIVRRTPEVIPKYIAKFDGAIKVNDNEIGDVDCEIKMDFKLLVPNTERGETELLLAFIEVGQKRVLKHPLCETFLFLKWRRIRKFFLFSLCFHAVYVLMFTLFILGVFVKDCSKPVPCISPGYVKYIGVFVLVLNSVMLGKELFQMAHGFMGYVKYWENWLQWTIILSIYSCVLVEPLMATDLVSIPTWQQHVAAIVILLVWIELMMLVGRFPIFGLYVQMFTKVAINFSKFLLAYSCLLIAFGLSFGVLFSDYRSFRSVPWALLKTVIMMAGELEFEDIFYEKEDVEYPVTSHAIFFAFVVLVTVILTNLLVGLAVSDITGLQASAGLDRLSRQAELVSRLEGLLYSKILKNMPRNIMRVCQRSALLRTSRCHLQFCVKPNDPREKRLPKDLIVSIYKLVAERRDRNQENRRKRNNTNYSFFKRSIPRVNTKDSDEVQLRKVSTHNLRNRTFSENPAGLHLNSPPIDEHSDFSRDNTLTRNESIKLTELVVKMERNQKHLTKKIDDMAKELLSIKMQLQQSDVINNVI